MTNPGNPGGGPSAKLYRQGPCGGTGGGDPYEKVSSQINDISSIEAWQHNTTKFISAVQIKGAGSDVTFGTRENATSLGVVQVQKRVGIVRGTYSEYIYTLQFLDEDEALIADFKTDVGEGKRPFRYDVPKGSKLVGFLGTSGAWLDSLGIVFAAPPGQ